MSELALIEAVKMGDRKQAEELIRNGADVNQQDEQGWTPLNFAAGRGDLDMVKLLVDNAADVFKVGRDQRTPYMIALAAGRVSVVRYLREVENRHPSEKRKRPERQYCKAYPLGDLRKFSRWSESRINWKDNRPGRREGEDAEGPFTDDKIVFIHQDFTVTESMWLGENVLFNEVDEAWQQFCSETLGFKVPDDLDLIVSNEATG
jgi:uncharacterized protein